MNKNILAENMIRFGVKNLNSNNKFNLLVLSEQNTPISVKPPAGSIDPVAEKQIEKTIIEKTADIVALQRQADVMQRSIDAETATVEFQKHKLEIDNINKDNERILQMISGDPKVVKRKLSRSEIGDLYYQLKVNRARVLEINGSQIKLSTDPTNNKTTTIVRDWAKISLEIVGSLLGSLKLFLMIRSEFKGDPVRTPKPDDSTISSEEI